MHLKTLSPSAADLEIRSLSPASEQTHFINALTAQLRRKQDYELVQAWMSVFLKLHSDVVVAGVDTGVAEALREWRSWQAVEGRRLGELVGWCAGVSGFLRSARV